MQEGLCWIEMSKLRSLRAQGFPASGKQVPAVMGERAGLSGQFGGR